jgi:hypothetical protein
VGDVVKTAALLPTPGDTFVTRYWARNYERVWKGEVDELVVLINGGTREARRALRDVGATIHDVPQPVGHGEALTRLVSYTDADVVVLVEDDAYVREPGAIAAHLERAAAGEVIGSPRGGMHQLLEQAALTKWGPVVGPDTSVGHGLWPCFLFVRTDILRQTTCDFAARWWQSGETVPGLGYRVNGTPVDTDTNTAVAFQLRDRGPITPVGQWKELWQKQLPAEGAPWFHAGGLSNLDKMPREGIGGTLEGKDWAHRIFWWERTAHGEPGYEDRMSLLRRMVEQDGIYHDLLDWEHALEPWINWDDQP